MDRYEFVEGGSSKFWEAGVEGATLTVRFGRVGTQGQTKDKAFPDAAAADKEWKKLVREKTGKGYALVGASMAPATAVAPRAAPAKTPRQAAPAVSASPASAPRPAEAAVAPAPAPITAAAAIERGRLVDAAPLPTRTRPGTGVVPGDAWAELHRLVASTAAPTEPEEVAAAAVLKALLDAPPPRTMTAPEARDLCNALITAHVHEGLRWRPFREVPTRISLARKLSLFAHWLVGSQGALLAVQAANILRPPESARANGSDDSGRCEGHSLGLRAAIVQAPEADYDAAVALCLRICEREPEWQLKAFFAFILADDRSAPHALQPLPVLEEAARQGVDVAAQRRLHPLIAEAEPSAVAPWRSKRGDLFYFAYCEVEAERIAATVVAAARHRGEPAVEPLTWLLAQARHADQTAVAEAMLETREEDALEQLLPVLHEKWVRSALDAAAESYPAWIFGRCLVLLAAGRAEPAIRARVLDGIERHGAATVRGWAAELGPKAVNQLDRLLGARAASLAPAEDWPAVLRSPPWRQANRAVAADIVLVLSPVPTPFAYRPTEERTEARYTYRVRQGQVLESLAGLRDAIVQAEAQPRYSWVVLPAPTQPIPRPDAPDGEVLAWLGRRLTQVNRATRFGIYHLNYRSLYDGLERQPDRLALMLWELTAPLLDVGLTWDDAAPLMLRRFGERALPGLLAVTGSDPVTGFEHFGEVDAAGLAPYAARALLKLKRARPLAIAWLRRHRHTALLRLVPDAVGPAGDARDAAEHALRWFRAGSAEDAAALAEVVARHAAAEPRVAEAVAQVLGRDPLLQVPSRIAKLPGWFTPSALSRPVLRASGDALPDAAVVAACEMLSFSTPDAVYAGVGVLKGSCTPASLGAFAWDLVSAWLAAGAPAKDGWALRALGWLGDDEGARQLTRLIRRWPGESAHARAVTGLDVLCDIGSDVALMNLNGIAEKLKFKGLQEKAREKIAALAEARELTPEELADRLAPDLDLDERGGLDLDFGSRRFRAAFDEFLRPIVKDADGKRLKDLPKPLKSDDAERAAEAVARWAALKKDARAIASLQLVRLESMLATGRRLKPEAFHTFFAAHPLIRNLARRLVWGLYADEAPASRPSVTFRVTEDLDYADADDDAMPLDVSPEAEGLIGLVHPLQVERDVLDAWGAVFGDYEIAQPFPQLGRETYRLTEAETAVSRIDRFQGSVVETARLRGMAGQGWPQGAPQDGGVVGWLERRVVFADGKAGLATLGLGEGIYAGTPEYEPKQQSLETLDLADLGRGGGGGEARRFGDLDPVTASEMLRGPSLLTAAGRP